MSNTFFLKSITPAYPGQECMDPLHDGNRSPCQLNTEKPEHYWNPRKGARIKQICPVCYAVRQFNYERRMERRFADLAAMDAHENNQKKDVDTAPRI